MSVRKFRERNGKHVKDNKPHKAEFHCRGKNCGCKHPWKTPARSTTKQNTLKEEA